MIKDRENKSNYPTRTFKVDQAINYSMYDVEAIKSLEFNFCAIR